MYLECVALHLLLYLNCKVFTKNPHFSSFFNFLHKLLNPVRTSGHLFFMNVEKVACRLLFERYGGPSPLATILMLPLLSLGRAPSPSRPNVWKVRLLLLCRYCMYGLCTATCIFSNLQCTWRTEKKVCEIQTHQGIKI